MIIMGAGAALSSIICLPDWPYFNKVTSCTTFVEFNHSFKDGIQWLGDSRKSSGKKQR
jgi:hypothetical protein